MNGVFAPYSIPNFQIDGYDVVVNKPKTAAYRAPGTPAGMFAPSRRSTSWRRSWAWTRWTSGSRTPSKEGDHRPTGRQVGQDRQPRR